MTHSRELPRALPPALDLPSLREPGPAQPPTAAGPDKHRTEPGTWREIIARFERELGPVSEEDTAEEVAASAGPPEEVSAPSVSDAGEREEALEAPLPLEGVESLPPEREEVLPPEREEAFLPDVEEPATSGEAPQPAEPPAPDEPLSPGERIEPGEPPLIDQPVPWEIESMTTPDYSPPPSIRDAAHDSWPVDTEDGDAVPAWGDDSADIEQGEGEEEASPVGEIGEILLDEVVPADPWDREPEPDEEAAKPSDFPLDAFIVPAGVRSMAGSGDDEIARRVAFRLDELARSLRDGGLPSLGSTDSVDELSRVLAAIVTGYVSRGG